MKNLTFPVAMLLSCSLMMDVPPTGASAQSKNVSSSQNKNNMNSFISIVEIPATNMSRAIKFYQAILDVNIERMKMPGMEMPGMEMPGMEMPGMEMPSMEMGILPYEGQVVTVVIMKGEGFQPSADGVTIYLNGGDNLQVILDKVEKNGGKIMVHKTPHADESGYYALFLDSEGNKMGLHSLH